MLDKFRQADGGKMKKLLSIMLKIGFIGFGGGTALIPVIEEETVEQSHLIDADEFNKDVIVANITPGALPVEIASSIGRKVCGLPGMVLAASCMALPGTLLTVLIVALINTSADEILWQIMFASVGVTAYIIFMLIEYAKGTYRECRINQNARLGVFLMLLVFLLTSGKELIQIFGLDMTPIFDVSIIQVLVVAFFVIFYTRGEKNKKRILIAAVVAVLYMLCVGKAHVISSVLIRSILQLIMIVLSILGLSKSIGGRVQFSFQSFKKLLAEECTWFLFLFILSVPAFILCRRTLGFLGQGLLSAVLSFGGGDAYLAIADGMFVNTGIVGEFDFYHKIAATANALPGSILCKVLSGVGYVIGYNQEWSVAAGIAVAVCGFACSVAASGGTVSAVMYIYERFENLDIFKLIKIYIRPIVAGLLLSVSASMLYQNMQISEDLQWSVIPILLLTAGIYGLNLLWKNKSVFRPILRVLLSAAISLAVCNVVYIANFI